MSNMFNNRINENKSGSRTKSQGNTSTVRNYLHGLKGSQAVKCIYIYSCNVIAVQGSEKMKCLYPM